MQIEFLAKNILSTYQFEVKNAVNETEIEAANGVVAFDVECSKSVTQVEVYDQTTQSWKKVSELGSGAVDNCVEGQAANFSLSYDQVGATAAPTTPGDQRKDVEVQLTVKNITGETNTYKKTYSALFKAPGVKIRTANNINVASGIGAAGSTYTVVGTCTKAGGTVVISSPFANDETVTCHASLGTFTADLTLHTALTDGTATITVDHWAAAPFYAYGSASKDIVIDRTAPVVTITSPADGASFTSSNTSSGKITVSGNCETGRNVTLGGGSSSSVQATCSAGVFTGELAVSQGSMTITASQTDAAGNSANDSVTVSVDTVGPTAVTSIGILSSLGTDTLPDSTLTDANPMIRIVSIDASATTFDMEIKNAAGTAVVCSKTGTAGGAAGTFDIAPTSCTLTNKTTYKVYVRSKDSVGNYADATQTIQVDYTIPKITGIFVSGPSEGRVSLNNNLHFDITYDRPVTVAGTPKISLNAKSGGRLVSFSAIKTGSNDRTLRFTYTVANGEYAQSLGFFTNAILYPIAGTDMIRDKSHGELANLTIASGLFTQNYIVDTVPPNSPSGLSKGADTPYYTKTPTLTFTLPSDPETLTSYIVLKKNGVTVHTEIGLASGSSISGLSLEKGVTYTVEVYARDPALNLSETPETITFTSFVCPNNFLYVYDEVYAPQPFCIAPIEARGPLTAVRFDAASYSSVPLKASYNQTIQAGSGCKSLSPAASYDLPTNAEWNAIANIIASRDDNWMRGSVAGSSVSNYVYVGVTGSPGATNGEPIVVGNLCYPGTCGTNPDRRVLYLPPIGTGLRQELWDFSGNMYEFQKGIDTTKYKTLAYSVGNSAAIPGVLGDSYKLKSCPVLSPELSPYYCGYGSVNFACSELSDVVGCTGTWYNVALPYILRGGSKGSYRIISPENNQQANNAGIYAAYRMADADSAMDLQGFRCVYHP